MGLNLLPVFVQRRQRNIGEATKWDLFLALAGDCMGRKKCPFTIQFPPDETRIKQSCNTPDRSNQWKCRDD